MKKLIIFFFLICVKSTFAQVVPDSVDLRSNSYSVTFSNNAPIGDKFRIAKKWFDANFHNYRDILITEDVRAGKIVLKPMYLFKADTYSQSYLATVITFECNKSQYSIKFEDIKKRSIFNTVANLVPADTVYLQSQHTTEVEINRYRRYRELKGSTDLSADDQRELKKMAYLEEYTEDKLREENMRNYTELQEIIAQIINKLKLTLDI